MKRILLFSLLLMLILTSCGKSPTPQVQQKSNGPSKPIKPLAVHTEATTNLAGGKESLTRDPQPLTLAELRAKYKSTFLLQGPSSPERVALTFDDAPDDHFTPLVLDVLKKYDVKATFFVVGNRAEEHPEMIQRMIREGHTLGNHSYSHPNFPMISDASFQQEVLKTNQIIQKLTGKNLCFIRPPYGNISEDQIKWLASQHIKIINWNVDSLDWTGLTADQVKTNIMSNLTSGAIVLQHAAGGVGEDLTGTVDALPQIITELRDKQIDMVTVPELLHQSAYR
ncbi:chitooligosaccharide deacetylase [Paenibacillus selenitireducens]|uniref:Chitooligosaccharide deacetylase n=1 Tax=Paenibacillus selenitireducens TaxID=1324314 RepID=A0A1T2XAV6_9BACL|nr:polysaccharide deacetylase family protein [Paenibacillus selenitireducens]OPA76826.1 chitooligosaccharide deacetylase [Paenibacillus selenitireducens]